MAKSCLKRGGDAIQAYRQSIDYLSVGGDTNTRRKERSLIVRASGTILRLELG